MIGGRNSHKPLRGWTALGVCGALLASGCASTEKVADTGAQTPAPQPTPAPVATLSDVLTATGTVRAVDAHGRRLAIKDARGKTLTFRVSEDVDNMARIKTGDRVTLKYTESTIVRMSRDTTKATPADQTVKNGTETLANILAIDAKTRKVTFQGPDRTLAFKAPADKDLSKVDVGDQVKLTYLDEMVVAIEPASAAKATASGNKKAAKKAAK